MGVSAKHPEIPDWRIYKVADAPELVKVEKRLAVLGLKDPWLRNEVWRYDSRWPTTGQRARQMIFKGFKWGLLLSLVHVGINSLSKKDDGHGHH